MASHALAALDDDDFRHRLLAARALARASAADCEAVDPGLARLLACLTRERAGADRARDRPLVHALLRAVGDSANPRYIPSLKHASGAIGDALLWWIARARLGDREAIGPLVAALQTSSLPLRPLLERLSGQRFRTAEQWQRWWDGERR